MDNNLEQELPIVKRPQGWPFKALIGLMVTIYGAMVIMTIISSGLGSILDFTTGRMASLGTVSSEVLLDFGAKFNYSILKGEYWRFITPLFLHIDLLHLIFNMMALWFISQSLQGIFGTPKLLVLYFISGLGGSIASFAFGTGLSAGASGAIFGMLGAHIYLFLRNKAIYRHIFGQSFLVLIAINVVYGLIQPNVDDLGHIGGLLVGCAMALVLGIKGEGIKAKNLVAGGVTLVLMVALAGYGFWHYPKTDDYAFYYVLDLAESGQDQEAVDALFEAYDQFPNSQKLKLLIDSLQ